MTAKSVFLSIFTLLTIVETCPVGEDFISNLALFDDFAAHFGAKSLVVHIPKPCLTRETISKLTKFSFLALPQQFYFAFHDQSEVNVSCAMGYTNSDLHAFILDPENNPDYLRNCFDNRRRDNRETWLMYGEETLVETVASIEDLSLDLDDDVFLAIPEQFAGISGQPRSGSIKLWEIYRIGVGYPVEHLPYGNWNSNTSSLNVSMVDKWYRRGDMKGFHLNLTSLEELPFMSKIELNPRTGKYDIAGSFADILDVLTAEMNFTFTLRPPEDGAWGGMQDDGSWNGMMGLVERMEVDIASTSLFQTRAREEDASFSIPLSLGYQQVFIKNPTNTYNFTAYLEPLTLSSWIVIFFFILSIPSALYFAASRPQKKSELSLGESYTVAYLSVIMMSLQNADPTKNSTRIAFALILICGSLLYWHWEAMLVSYLSTRKTIMPFNNLEEMYRNTKFRLALIPATTYEDNFKYSSDPIWKAIYEERLGPYIQEYQDYENHITDMLHFIRNDFETGLYDSYAAISNYPEYLNCEIVATSGKYFFRPYAWAFQKHSPYLDIFNFYLKEFKEKGTLGKIEKKYEPQPQVCPDLSGKPIEFSNCFTAFLALLGGITFGIIAMGVEHLVRPYKEFWFNKPYEKDEFLSPFQHSFMLQENTKGEEPHELKKVIKYQQKLIQDLHQKLLKHGGYFWSQQQHDYKKMNDD